MSYFVIKGPRNGRFYLCSVPGYSNPQWLEGSSKRQVAHRFPDEDSAWKWLAMIVEKHGADYLARPVRVNTIRDWRAEREQLRAEIAALRERRATPTGGASGEGRDAK